MASLPSLGLDRDDTITEALTAVAHAVLATVNPRNARPGKGGRVQAPRGRHGGSPRERWIHGHDDNA